MLPGTLELQNQLVRWPNHSFKGNADASDFQADFRARRPLNSSVRPMKETRILKVSAERPFSAHHMLMEAARSSLAVAEQQPGWAQSELIAITFSALAIEALCNTIGGRVVKTWSDFESASPNAKLRILCDELGVDYKSEIEPWATARWLFRFRNQIVHAKPELVQKESLISQEKYEQHPTEFPKSKVEREITLGNARRAVAAVTSIRDALSDKVPAENALGLHSDAMTRSASFDKVP